MRDKDLVKGVPLTLGGFLAARYEHHSLEQWCALITGGSVKLNGNTVTDLAVCVKAHQQVSYMRAPWVEPAVPAMDQLTVLLEDEHLAVLHKPSGCELCCAVLRLSCAGYLCCARRCTSSTL